MPRRPANSQDQDTVIEDLADDAQLLRLGFQAGDRVEDDDDPEGGVSDLDRSVHRWLNPVAKVVIRR